MTNILKKPIRDSNAERKLTAIRKLQRLLVAMEQPAFSGSVELLVHAYQGKIGKIRARLDDWDEPHSLPKRKTLDKPSPNGQE